MRTVEEAEVALEGLQDVLFESNLRTGKVIDKYKTEQAKEEIAGTVARTRNLAGSTVWSTSS
jgi:hypothetical protein